MSTPLQVHHDPVNIAEMEQQARERLSQMAFDYYISGAGDEITVRENHAAYQRITLHPHVLRNVGTRDLTTTVLGLPVSMPILVAPTAFQKMAHPDGEVATVRAAGKAGTIMTLSTLSNSSVEHVTAESSGPVWFQLYVYKERAVTEALVRRAESAGCKALVLTVDTPMLGRRERDVRNRFQLPQDLAVANLIREGLEQLPADIPDSGLAAYIMSLMDASLTWKDLEWLRSITNMPVLVKGVLRPDDACRAVAHGVSGIIVSNHGGRQLDTVPATITVLPKIVEAVRGEVEVLVDGGIRRGTDVIKALACGARAVLVGRPVLWGLAINGESGVSAVLEMLRSELDLAMGLCGMRSISEISADLLG